ncbi:hypothetical protein JXB28_02130 [Candidatus Woesearchaeota archaeon]|nr:hypothetical protein [Candidatus Woesearchaeota archaeon]
MPRKKKIQKVKGKRGRPPKNKSAENAANSTLANALADQPMHESHPYADAASHKHHALRDAPQENYFILCNGKPVKNMKELADLMEELEEHVFNYHVSPEKNDFATWIKDVFKDLELAEKLAGLKDKQRMQLVIYKHITHKLW